MRGGWVHSDWRLKVTQWLTVLMTVKSSPFRRFSACNILLVLLYSTHVMPTSSQKTLLQRGFFADSRQVDRFVAFHLHSLCDLIW